MRVTLYFPDQNGQFLHPEERDIPKPAGGAAFLKALFAELQKGPAREGLMAAVPGKMQLRNAFLLPEGQAVLDLAVDAGLAFGSDEELTIVASLVDTTLQNVAETSRVRILVNGEPAETLGGHVDLTRPAAFHSQRDRATGNGSDAGADAVRDPDRAADPVARPADGARARSRPGRHDSHDSARRRAPTAASPPNCARSPSRRVSPATRRARR